MRLIRALSLTLLVVLYGTPPPARADALPEAFALPDGRASEAYQADVEVVLRDRYRLKIDTGARSSIVQWFLAEGELPPGLTVRTDGTIAGTPLASREQAYRFRVKAVDAAVAGSEPLVIELTLQVTGPKIKLTRINAPTLVPVGSESGAPARIAADMRGATAEGERATRAETAVSSPRGGLDEGGVPVMASINSSAAEASARARPAKAEDFEPTLALLTKRGAGRRRSRNVVAKVAGALGLAQKGGGKRGGARQEEDEAESKDAGCTDTNKVAVSDEAHSPLKGDTSTQPTCVKFKNLNVLRYKIEYNTETIRGDGPNITGLPFIPKFTAAPSTPVSQAATPKPEASALRALLGRQAEFMAIPRERRTAEIEKRARDFEEELAELDARFNAILDNNLPELDDLSDIETFIRESVETKANNVAAKVKTAHESSKILARIADEYLQSNNDTKLVERVETVKGDVDYAMGLDWPTDNINASLNRLGKLSARLEQLKDEDAGQSDPVSQDAWVAWLNNNQDRLNQAKTRITEFRARVNTVGESADEFDASKNVLREWQYVLGNVASQKEAAFRQESEVSCRTDEDEKKTSKLTITKYDRLNSNQSVSREVLTVNCYSRVAVTGGLNFSSLNEREFSVVQSAGETAGTVVKKFGFTSQSSFRPNPLLLLNVRFTDNPVYNWHASFGAVVDRQGQIGTDLEPVGGVSFSIRRLIFITPFAVHIGRETRLAGGFKVGDLVPDAVATPPLEKAWKLGYTAGVTFRIAPQ